MREPGKGQTALRDELAVLVLEAVRARNVDLVEAATACMGAAAIMLACLPPESADDAAEFLAGGLHASVKARAREIGRNRRSRRAA